jgi:ATP phosphoribosyltransferase regulatory subunit
MIPEGMRDVLPAEAAQLHAIEEILRGRFAAYGYLEVRTPALEYAETLEVADDDVIGGGYRVFDDQGHVLMLRTDMTVPLARLAGTRFEDKPLPLRFSYIDSCFRPPGASRGQDGQFLQAGAELIGAAGAQADAEVVALVCELLSASGLREYTVSLGTVAFRNALVASLRLPADQAEAALDALAERDYPLLESIVSNAGVDDDGRRALQKALDLGGGDSALSQARKLALGAGMEHAVDHLVAVRELLEEYGFADHVQFDFGLYPELTYYTGVIFEAFAPGVGLPVAQGGRYDELLASFEWPVTGVGFAVALDRLNMALEEARVALPVRARPLSVAGGLERPELVAELRRAGLDVASLPADARLTPPSLRHADGDWILDAGTGREVRGSLRDVRRALGLS